MNGHLQVSKGLVLASQRPAGWPAVSLRRLKDELHGLLSGIGFPWDLGPRQLVLLKPNLNHVPGQREWPGTTPLVLRALHEVVREGLRARVVFLEAPGIGRHAQDCYRVLKAFEPHLETAEMIDPAAVPHVEIRSPLRAVSLRLPRPYLDATLVVDVPRAKTHSLTTVSLGIKNLFGLLDEPTRRSNHTLDRVDAILSDLVAIRPPEYTLIDCLAPIEGQGPLYGSAVWRGWLVASNSVVAADTEAARILGVDPETVSHLTLSREGLERIGHPVGYHLELLGASGPRESVLPAKALHNPFPQITVIAAEHCERGHLNAITHSLCRLADEGWESERTVAIIVGRTCQTPPTEVDRWICFGDEAVTTFAGTLASATAIPGNPPDAFALYHALVDSRQVVKVQ